MFKACRSMIYSKSPKFENIFVPSSPFSRTDLSGFGNSLSTWGKMPSWFQNRTSGLYAMSVMDSEMPSPNPKYERRISLWYQWGLLLQYLWYAFGSLYVWCVHRLGPYGFLSFRWVESRTLMSFDLKTTEWASREPRLVFITELWWNVKYLPWHCLAFFKITKSSKLCFHKSLIRTLLAFPLM